MNGIIAIGPVGAAAGEPLALRLAPPAVAPQQAAPGAGFGDVLMAGLKSVDAKVSTADALVQRFAVDDSVPVHQVTMALEQARLSVELAMQVRSRLVETYRDLMGMQL
jgi:flagellar hook-basal body complex protein FliE